MIPAKISQPLSGDKLYQERARRALPLLVRQAQAQTTIYYSDLALELGMSNPRNLNYVLGSIGQALQVLSKEWGEEIPPIQCLVVNRQTEMPGEGIGWFIINKADFRKLTREQQREVVKAESQRVFTYRKWLMVLTALKLRPITVDYSELLSKAAAFRGGGEGESHKKLKLFIAHHPEVLNLPKTVMSGKVEYPLPSGDSLDVLFKDNDEWIAVEVKSSASGLADIARGLFQCVKYKAVIKAWQAVKSSPPSARTILVLEGSLPESLISVKNTLGIEVVGNIVPR